MVIVSNKIMQNFRKNYPQKGVMVITPDAVVFVVAAGRKLKDLGDEALKI